MTHLAHLIVLWGNPVDCFDGVSWNRGREGTTPSANEERAEIPVPALTLVNLDALSEPTHQGHDRECLAGFGVPHAYLTLVVLGRQHRPARLEDRVQEGPTTGQLNQ